MPAAPENDSMRDFHEQTGKPDVGGLNGWSKKEAESKEEAAPEQDYEARRPPGHLPLRDLGAAGHLRRSPAQQLNTGAAEQ